MKVKREKGPYLLKHIITSSIMKSIWVVMATLYRLGLVCFDWGKDAWGGCDVMGIKVVEGLRWPAAGVGGGHDCGMGILACVSLSDSNLSLWDSFLMSPPVVPSNLALLGLYPGCSNPSSSYLLYSSPSDSYPLYSGPSGPFLFQSCHYQIPGPPGGGWSQSKVRGGQVVIVIVVEMIRLMGTATVVVVIWLLGTATFIVHVGSSISIVHLGLGFEFSLYLNLNLLRGLGSGILLNLIPKPQVQNQVRTGFGRFRNWTVTSLSCAVHILSTCSFSSLWVSGKPWAAISVAYSITISTSLSKIQPLLALNVLSLMPPFAKLARVEWQSLIFCPVLIFHSAETSAHTLQSPWYTLAVRSITWSLSAWWEHTRIKQTRNKVNKVMVWL